MGEILQFRPRSGQTFTSRDRVEAMVKGQLDEYTCDSCGGVFEVLFDEKPNKCPHCKRQIRWE